MIDKLNVLLVGKKIIRHSLTSSQYFQFDLEDDKLNIGGDIKVKTVSIRSFKKSRPNKLDMIIEKVTYIKDGGLDLITINDDLELSFVTETGSYIFISFGNTIEHKLTT